MQLFSLIQGEAEQNAYGRVAVSFAASPSPVLGSVSPDGTQYYRAGTVVTIVATPESGYKISTPCWTGSGASRVVDVNAASTTYTASPADGTDTVVGNFESE